MLTSPGEEKGNNTKSHLFGGPISAPKVSAPASPVHFHGVRKWSPFDGKPSFPFSLGLSQLHPAQAQEPLKLESKPQIYNPAPKTLGTQRAPKLQRKRSKSTTRAPSTMKPEEAQASAPARAAWWRWAPSRPCATGAGRRRQAGGRRGGTRRSLSALSHFLFW